MKKTKRKLLSLFTAMLAVVLLLSLAGCGGAGGTSNSEAEALNKTTYVCNLAGFQTTWTFTKSELTITYDDPSGTDIDVTGKYWINDAETQITFRFNADAKIALIPGTQCYIVPTEWLSGEVTLPYKRVSETEIRINYIPLTQPEKT